MILGHASRLALLAFFAVGVATGTASAQDIPDLKGTWEGELEESVVALGDNPHVPESSGVAYPVPKITIVIEEQNGRRFVGRVVSPARSEQLIGVFRHDLDTGIMVDDDGSYDIDIRNADTIDVCYSHTQSDSRVVACYVIRRAGK